MDIHSATWQVAVEAAGIWPSIVVLGSDNRLFLLLYHRMDGEDRVLTVGGRTCAFEDMKSLNSFIEGPHTGVPNDVHLALEVLSSLTPDGLSAEHFPRNLVEQSIFWIAGGRMLSGTGQVQRLLETLAFLKDWHDSLQEEGMVGRWPDSLDDASQILTDVVVTHQITTLEAAERLETRKLRPVLAGEVEDLLRWSA